LPLFSWALGLPDNNAIWPAAAFLEMMVAGRTLKKKDGWGANGFQSDKKMTFGVGCCLWIASQGKVFSMRNNGG
jgi:hypothetical protein